MSKKNINNPSEEMLQATLQGFHEVKKAMDTLYDNQKQQAKATYTGLTASGKSRYVGSLVDSCGSQAGVADLLDISRSRVNQLLKSEKNRRNGK